MSRSLYLTWLSRRTSKKRNAQLVALAPVGEQVQFLMHLFEGTWPKCDCNPDIIPNACLGGSPWLVNISLSTAWPPGTSVKAVDLALNHLRNPLGKQWPRLTVVCASSRAAGSTHRLRRGTWCGRAIWHKPVRERLLSISSPRGGGRLCLPFFVW